MEPIVFDHNARSVSGALGLSDDRKLEIEAYVIYAILSTEIIARKLYGDDRDAAPPNMRSKSGTLEKVLDYALDEAELVYMAYEFATQDKFTDTPEGKIFASAVAMRLQDDEINLDEEKFIEWWKKMRSTAEKKARKED